MPDLHFEALLTDCLGQFWKADVVNFSRGGGERRANATSNSAEESPSFFSEDHTSKTWCGRRDLNPHGPFKPCGFSYRLRLSPPGCEAFRGSRQVCGLDYPFTLPRKLRSLGAARLVSTPSRLVSLRAWLGIAI